MMSVWRTTIGPDRPSKGLGAFVFFSFFLGVPAAGGSDEAGGAPAPSACGVTTEPEGTGVAVPGGPSVPFPDTGASRFAGPFVSRGSVRTSTLPFLKYSGKLL